MPIIDFVVKKSTVSVFYKQEANRYQSSEYHNVNPYTALSRYHISFCQPEISISARGPKSWGLILVEGSYRV